MSQFRRRKTFGARSSNAPPTLINALSAQGMAADTVSVLGGQCRDFVSQLPLTVEVRFETSLRRCERTRTPAGVAAGLYLGRWQSAGMLGPAAISPAFPKLDAFTTAAAVLLTAQLPLTLANSVIATADAAHVYFPERASRATPRRLSVSIALGNLWAGPFGGLPICHGSGGLTAHYKMGARTPTATALLGIMLTPCPSSAARVSRRGHLSPCPSSASCCSS